MSMDVREVIKSRCVQVEPVMAEYARMGDARIQEMIMHPIESGGKRIRPCLTLLACEAVGSDSSNILPAAASVELLHTFTLVHDDIMDADLERRGKPTVHSLWGEPMGIIVGDALYSSAFKALTDLRGKLDDETVLDAVDALVKANEELQEGQIMDMLFEGQETVTEKEYMTMIRKKTGALIEAAVKIGAIVGGADNHQVKALELYGSNCGVAFQVKDDVLDLTADAQALGKPVGSDIRKGKKTLIIVHALEHASQEDKKIIDAVLGKADATDREIHEVIDALARSGSIDYAESMVSNLIDESKKALDALKDTKARQSLARIAEYLVERDM